MIFQGLKEKIYSIYSDESYIVQRKAYALFLIISMYILICLLTVSFQFYDRLFLHKLVNPIPLIYIFVFIIFPIGWFAYLLRRLFVTKYERVRKFFCMAVYVGITYLFVLVELNGFRISGINFVREFIYVLVVFLGFFYSRKSIILVVIPIPIISIIFYFLFRHNFSPVVDNFVILSRLAGNLSLVLVGLSLYVMINITDNSLDRTEQELERNKVLNRNLDLKVKQRTQKLNDSYIEIEESNRKIIGSIEYAQRIQNSLLPAINLVNELIPQNFIIWKPRDIVGGDIYYIDRCDEGIIIAMIDCTGHGVPGAFMTMLASSSFRRITVDEQCSNPAEILKRLNTIVKTSLQQDTERVDSDDGLDASVCLVNTFEKKMTFAGARLPLTYVKDNEVVTVKGDRQSIGYKKSDLNFEFSNHEIEIEDGMSFYFHTDGIIDQLGGEQRMPFGKRRFNDLLLKNHDRSPEEQKNMISEAFEKYKGSNETQDDITVMGFRV